MKPFIKWVGGKTKLIDAVLSVAPPHFERYVEPFIGGGAVFLHVLQQRQGMAALIADMNRDLVGTWEAVRNGSSEFFDRLNELNGPSSKAKYLKARKEFNDTKTLPHLRAADFIYLNKSCFNGLWRVNKKGHFNVPYNDADRVNLEIHNIAAVHDAMQLARVAIWTAGFAGSMAAATEGDFVYLDPPYYKTFSNYTKDGFTYEDHVSLADAALRCVKAGAHVVCSQGDNLDIIDIWARRGFAVWEVTRQSNVSANATSRKKVYEYIISSYREGKPLANLLPQVP